MIKKNFHDFMNILFPFFYFEKLLNQQFPLHFQTLTLYEQIFTTLDNFEFCYFDILGLKFVKTANCDHNSSRQNHKMKAKRGFERRFLKEVVYWEAKPTAHSILDYKNMSNSEFYWTLVFMLYVHKMYDFSNLSNPNREKNLFY